MFTKSKFQIDTHFEVVIIGGGIVGAGIFRDLSLHNVKTLLVDKGDFCSQTSQSSSKMLHGGIRYLEQMDFSLIKEALQEKNLWLKLAPESTTEQRFYLPIYQNSKYNMWQLKTGLWLYDFLSQFKNKPHQMVNKDELLKFFPGLNPSGLKGAGSYHDGVVDDAKLGIDCILDGLISSNSSAKNYTELINIKYYPSHYELTLKDTMTQQAIIVTTQFLVFATGPFTDQLFKKLNLPWTPKLAPSKGIHVWLSKDKIPFEKSMVLTTHDQRVVFLIPQRDRVLLGTTETKTNEDFFNIKANDEDILYLLNVFKLFFPKIEINFSDIISSYAGIRPLVIEEGKGLGKISRHHKLYRPTSRSYVLMGGKYTTFRTMAQDVCQEILPRLSKTYLPFLTLNPLRVKSKVSPFSQGHLDFSSIENIIKTQNVRKFEDLLQRRLSLIIEDDLCSKLKLNTDEIRDLKSLINKS